MLSEMEQFQQDLLESVKQMKRGKAARLTDVSITETTVRSPFTSRSCKVVCVTTDATKLGSKKRRQPTGITKTLLKVGNLSRSVKGSSCLISRNYGFFVILFLSI